MPTDFELAVTGQKSKASQVNQFIAPINALETQMAGKEDAITVLPKSKGGFGASIAAVGNGVLKFVGGALAAVTRLGLADGGTNTDLSATGGAGCVLKQKTVGGDIAVEPLGASDIPFLLLPYCRNPVLKQQVWGISGGSGAGSGKLDSTAVPTGKKWLILGFYATNGAATTTTYSGYIKRSGSYYFVGGLGAGTLGAGANANSNIACPILYAGEAFALETSQSGLTVWLSYIEMDAASLMESATLTSFSSGNNLLYTVPAEGIIPLATSGTGLPYFGSNLAWVYTNKSGASCNVYGNLVPSGGSPAAPGLGSNAVRQAAASVADSGFHQVMPGLGMPAIGDLFYLNTNSNASGQFAWLNYLRYS